MAHVHKNPFEELGNGDESAYESNMIISTEEDKETSNSTNFDSGSTHNMKNGCPIGLTNYEKKSGSVTVGDQSE